MNDLYGVLTVIGAYPVHILTFFGCILLLILVIPKRKRRHKLLSIFPDSVAKSVEYTVNEKHLLAEKINESRSNNLKKSLAGSMSSKGMLFSTLGFIVLTILFVLGMILL
ncbi:MAG: hypothetical protein OXD54_04640 [Candidatus Poribacteria bacterium]|nr:hypothetical protein [Candidatus Poribacteria bacterium]